MNYMLPSFHKLTVLCLRRLRGASLGGLWRSTFFLAGSRTLRAGVDLHSLEAEDQAEDKQTDRHVEGATASS